MPMIDTLVAEFDREAAVTRRVLERVPEDRLSWQPHAKSMSLARLAGHITELPAWGPTILQQDDFDFAAAGYEPFIPQSRDELLASFEAAVEKLHGSAAGVPDERLFQTWRLRRGEEVVLEMPAVAALRGFILSHSIHHRGQLSVYLRLLDVPVPAIYGPSADEPAL